MFPDNRVEFSELCLSSLIAFPKCEKSLVPTQQLNICADTSPPGH